MSRRSILIVVVGCAVMAASWYFFLWGPATKSYASTKANLDTATQQQDSLTAQVATLKKADVAKLTSDVATLNSAIPATPQLDQFFHQIQDAATSSGEALSAVAPAEPAAPQPLAKGASVISGVSEIRVAVTATGSYAQASKFIDTLDASQRLVVIDGINVAQDPASGDLITQLTLRVFSTQKVASKAATATAATPAAPTPSGAK